MSTMEDKFSHLPDISTTQPDRLIKYRVSDDGFAAEVLLPGFSYTDFDRKIGGKLSLWSVAKMMESIRVLALRKLIDSTLFSLGDSTIFLARSMLELSPLLQSDVYLYQNGFSFQQPMLFRFYLSHMGETSFTHVTEWTDFQTKKSLGRFIVKSVYISTVTRRPKQLPTNFVPGGAKYLQSVESKTNLEKLESVYIPSNAFKHPIQVRYSDCDINNHVNQASYLSYCLHSGTAAAVKGQLKHFKQNIEAYPIKSIDIQYLGEVLVGDNVNVCLWEAEKKPGELMFAINVNEKIVFTMVMKIHQNIQMSSKI
ncbi:uncharacterized protein LOC127860371 isoform X2 [Dreissena polymorpha]|uniref:uncharacterized protein LOC127860371 isoform X2 n=1 Tax=Dreissena polymorpha TaxID=45954 RepID=UPI0022650F60|nr:uncharacterized protein LOC127860371 isoform X2 [Dreissena polymorpha]